MTEKRWQRDRLSKGKLAAEMAIYRERPEFELLRRHGAREENHDTSIEGAVTLGGCWALLLAHQPRQRTVALICNT